MDSIVSVSYEPKISKACLQYRKGYGSCGELPGIGGTSSKTMYGPKISTSRKNGSGSWTSWRHSDPIWSKRDISWTGGNVKGKM